MQFLAVFDDIMKRWATLSVGWRLVVGTCLVLLVGYIGQNPKMLFGVSVVWPYAALWAAVGWGIYGISIRPLILLTLFGFVQDIHADTLLGCFMIVNLTTYGISAWIGENFDLEADPLRRLFFAPLCIGVGFFVLWVLASSILDYGVSIGPLVWDYVVTLGGYVAVSAVFRLQPDRIRGR